MGFRIKKKKEYNRAVLTELAISEPLSMNINDEDLIKELTRKFNEEIALFTSLREERGR